jgi:ATP-binding cassette subfamily B multidrug efflux pump
MSDRHGSAATPRPAVAPGIGPERPRGPGFGLRGGHGPMMGAPVEKAKNFRASMKRLLACLAPQRWALFAVIAMAGGSTAFAIFSPKILGRATTKLFQGLMARMMHLPGAAIDFDGILRIILSVAALYVASALFSYLQQFIMAGVTQRTIYDLRREVNAKLSRLPLSFYDGRTHGEILSRVTNDLDNIGGTLQQSLTQVISSVATLIGTLVMMLTISPLLTLIVVVVVPLALIVTQVVAPRSQKHFKTQWASLGQLNGHVEEMYTGHVIVKAFGRERRAIEQFNETNEKLYDSSWRAQFISGLLHPLMSFINNIGYVAVAVVGGIMVTKRVIEIGDIQAFIQYSRQFTMPIAQTATIANLLQSTAASAERVFELLDEKEEVPDAPDAASLRDTRGAVRFEGVRFSYKSEVPLIEDMNIAVAPGDTVAIVGPTGAGKTTLVNLLMRFYDVQGGRITVDGTGIRDVQRGSLRCAFGMVLQDTWLFNGTIRDNIAYGRDGVSDEEIQAAAAAAHADHFIRTLPDGYATVLNEEASNISQGQKQLLTIARAILTDPAMLILDEATSSVDTRTEVLIQKAMASLRKGRTSFVIAHRLSTIRDAKLILVMASGRIVERGTHRELLAMRGFYAELYNSQFTGADIEVDEKARAAEKARVEAEAAARMAARLAAATRSRPAGPASG